MLYCRNGGVKQAMSKLWGPGCYLNIFQSCVALDRGVLVGLIGLLWNGGMRCSILFASRIFCVIYR